MAADGGRWREMAGDGGRWRHVWACVGMCVCVAPPSPAREMCAHIAPPFPKMESPEHVQCAVLHGRLLWLQACATMVAGVCELWLQVCPTTAAGLLHGRLRWAARRQLGGRRARREALAAARRAGGVGRRERAQAEIVLAWHAAIGQATASVVARALAVVPPRRSSHRAHRGRVHHAAAPGRGREVAAGAEGLCPRAHREGRVLGQRLQRTRRAQLAVKQGGLLRLLGGKLPGLVGTHVAWWVRMVGGGTSRGHNPRERCAPATPHALRTPSLARPRHPHTLPTGGRPSLTSRRCRFEDDHARAALRARQREASRQRIHTGQRLPPRVEVACLGPHPDWRGEEPHAGFVHEHLGRQVSGLGLGLGLLPRVKVRDRVRVASRAPGLARLGRPSGTLPGTRGTRVAQGSPRSDRRLRAGARRGKWIGDWTGLAAVPQLLKVGLPLHPHRRAPPAAFPAPHPALSTKSAGASARHLRGGCVSCLG